MSDDQRPHLISEPTPERVITREMIEGLIARGARRSLVEFALTARLDDERRWTEQMRKRIRELE